MHSFFLILLEVSLSIFSGAIQTQVPINEGRDAWIDNVFDPSFDKYVEQLLGSLKVPGLSVAVVDIHAEDSNQFRSKVCVLTSAQNSNTKMLR